MSCSCRAAPWRAFVQSMAQVHRLEGAWRRFAGAPPPRPAQRCRLLDASRQQRSFHVSAPRRDAAETVAAVPKETARDAGAASEAASEAASGSPRVETVQGRPGAASDEGRFRSSPQRPSRQCRKPSREERQTEGPALELDGNEPDGGAIRKAKPKQRWRTKADAYSADTRRKDSASKDSASKNRAQRVQPARQTPKRPEQWRIQKAALKAKFPEGWNPRKRLSPDALSGIRALHAALPDVYTTGALADRFKVSPEAVRRILRSNWEPTAEQEEERRDRWFRRGKQVWEQQAALGMKPPRRWRMEGIVRSPEYHARKERAVERERQLEDEEVRLYRERRAAIRELAEEREQARAARQGRRQAP